jgi:membrane protein YdbS with pleckstrin-like domain
MIFVLWITQNINWVLLSLIPIAVIAGLIIWTIKVKRYSFQKDRVVFSSWIFYKKNLSIPYIRFNFIENSTWFTNKIFGNGNVWIFTIWSGKKEMNIKNIPNYTDVYNLLNKD